MLEDDKADRTDGFTYRVEQIGEVIHTRIDGSAKALADLCRGDIESLDERMKRLEWKMDFLLKRLEQSAERD